MIVSKDTTNNKYPCRHHHQHQHQHHNHSRHHHHNHNHYHQYHNATASTIIVVLRRCFLLSFFILLLLELPSVKASTNINNSNDNDNTTNHQNQNNHHHHHHRIAIFIPFLSKSTPILPSYFPFFLQSVDGLSSLIDFFIFHNGQLSPLIVEHPISTCTTTSHDCHCNHTNSTNSTKCCNCKQRMIMDIEIPSNVKFIDLQNIQQFTHHLLQIMNVKTYHEQKKNKNNKNNHHNNNNDDKDDNDSSYETIHKYYTQFLSQNPYLLIEFKPAFGYIFQNYINKPLAKTTNHNNEHNEHNGEYYYYTHWGYSDTDIFFGDLLSWITLDELNHFDIVTYGFGDQDKVYLRGQFTFHKNDVPLQKQPYLHYQYQQDEKVQPLLPYTPSDINNQHSKQIYMLWTQCDYLYHFNERFLNVLHKKNHFQVQSAEGCYSSVVISSSKTKKLKVKYAVKAWTNFNDDVNMHQYGVSTIFINDDDNNNKQKKRNILFKKTLTATGSEYLHLISQINTTSIITSSSQIPNTMQWEVGEKTLVRTLGKGAKCMSWAPPQYQFNLCIDPSYNVTNRDTIFLIDGELYKQSFEEEKDLFFLSQQFRYHHSNIIESSSLFHIQEWKRRYRSTQLLSLKMPKNDIMGWTILPVGVVPLFGRSNIHHLSSLENLEKSVITPKRNFSLPSQYFCLQFKSKKVDITQSNESCLWAISWKDQDVHKLIGPDWDDSHHESTDITLALTLQLQSSAFINNEGKLDALLGIIETNISVWKDQPVIIIVCITGHGGKQLGLEITTRLKKIVTSLQCSRYLVGIVQKGVTISSEKKEEPIVISSNALLNMAEAASTTRWTISGLDIENRGTILSKEIVYYAKNAALVHESRYGSVFIIPDFQLSRNDQVTGTVSITELIKEKERNSVIPTSIISFKNMTSDIYVNDILNHIKNSIYSLWWKYLKTNQLLSTSMDETTTNELVQLTYDIVTHLNQLITKKDDAVWEQSPRLVLMLDRYAPRMNDRILLTQYLISEIDELYHNMNLLRLIQMSILDYKIFALSGAFSISSPKSIANNQLLEVTKDKQQNVKVMTEERTRIAKTMILNNDL